MPGNPSSVCIYHLDFLWIPHLSETVWLCPFLHGLLSLSVMHFRITQVATLAEVLSFLYNAEEHPIVCVLYFKRFSLFLVICVCVFMCICTLVQVPKETRRECQSEPLEMESPDVGAGT